MCSCIEIRIWELFIVVHTFIFNLGMWGIVLGGSRALKDSLKHCTQCRTSRGLFFVLFFLIFGFVQFFLSFPFVFSFTGFVCPIGLGFSYANSRV